MTETKKLKPKERGSSATIMVREMELEDIPAVFALGEKLFPADKFPNLYRTWDEYELVDLFVSDGETCLVAELEDKIVGFALGTMIQKRRSAWTYGYLLWLGADTDVGPRGVGSKLFHRIQELFLEHGARMLLVDTAAENEQALRFFRKQGFGHEQGHVFLSKNVDAQKELRENGKHTRTATANKRPRRTPAHPKPATRRIAVEADSE